MKLINKIMAMIMSIIILCTTSVPVYAIDNVPKSRAEYAQVMVESGYPVITTSEVLEKFSAVADFFRVMTNNKFPTKEKLDISFDKFLTNANLYIVKNSGVDVELILRNLPPLNTVSSLIVDTYEIDTKAFRDEMYAQRDKCNAEGNGLGIVYHLLGCYLSVIEKIELYANPTDNSVLYEVCFDVTYNDGGKETFNTGMFINTETGELSDLEGKGMLGLGFNFNFSDMVIYTVVDAWTRNFGFAVTYDVLANAIGVYDYVTRRYKFDYDGLEWMIQVWKGTYFYVTNGAEVGIYNRVPGEELGTFYNCASDEQMMEMQMKLSYKDILLFETKPQKHWWLTGFHLSGTVYDPEALTMEYSIVFPNTAMLNAFTNAIDTEENRDATYVVDGTKISIVW